MDLEKRLNNCIDNLKTEYTTDELQFYFKVIGFGFGYCAVQCKTTGEKGSFDFEHRLIEKIYEDEEQKSERIYFNYKKA